MSCSRTQHGDASGDRTQGPLDSESDLLSLSHHGPIIMPCNGKSTLCIYKSQFTNHKAYATPAPGGRGGGDVERISGIPLTFSPSQVLTLA